MPDFNQLVALLKQRQLSPEFTQREEDVNPVGPPRPEIQKEENVVVPGKTQIGPPAPMANQATNPMDFITRAHQEFQKYQNPYEASANADALAQQQNQMKLLALKRLAGQ